MSATKTKMFCDDRNTMDAIIEYAITKGFMSRCGDKNGNAYYHFADNFETVDQVIMMAKEEGMLLFYEDNGTCYRLTQKGEDWYVSYKLAQQKDNSVTQSERKN